jgi:hypothetical protein
MQTPSEFHQVRIKTILNEGHRYQSQRFTRAIAALKRPDSTAPPAYVIDGRHLGWFTLEIEASRMLQRSTADGAVCEYVHAAQLFTERPMLRLGQGTVAAFEHTLSAVALRQLAIVNRCNAQLCGDSM